MPSWNIHLEAGERLASKLHLSGREKRQFLTGCLLPDINNGYINSPKKTYPHHDTHYAFDEKSSLNFYADYSEQVRRKDPIFLGYLFHLFIDGFFNYNFYHNFKKSPLSYGLDEDKKRDIKHHDFWLFDTNFHHTLDLSLDEASVIASKSNQIANVKISPEDLLEVDEILQDDHLNDSIVGSSYIFCSRESLEKVLEDSIKEFMRQYIESDVPGPRHFAAAPSSASTSPKGDLNA